MLMARRSSEHQKAKMAHLSQERISKEAFPRPSHANFSCKVHANLVLPANFRMKILKEAMIIMTTSQVLGTIMTREEGSEEASEEDIIIIEEDTKMTVVLMVVKARSSILILIRIRMPTMNKKCHF
jgi:hypothetical protein